MPSVLALDDLRQQRGDGDRVLRDRRSIGGTSLVFTGGVGEHAADLRDGICRRLLALRATAPTDAPTDAPGSDQLAGAGIRVEVVPADEELILDELARSVVG